MSSIADKFKKFMPARDDSVTVRADSAATLAFDNAETLQPPEEKTVLLRKEYAEEPSPVAEPMLAANDAPVDVPLTPEMTEAAPAADPALAMAGAAAEPPRSGSVRQQRAEPGDGRRLARPDGHRLHDGASFGQPDVHQRRRA